MKTIYFLTIMQLKDKLDLSKKTKFSLLFKTVFSILKFVLVTAVIYLAFYILSYFKWVSLDGHIPNEILIILLTMLLGLSILTCTIKIMDSLYFGKDNAVLLTMPVTKAQLFISKLLLFFVYELVKNIVYLLPLFIAFGMINAYPFFFYLWIIPCWFLFTILIVSIGGLLSIPSMLINILQKKYFWLKTILASALVITIVLLIIKLISILPTSFNFVETWSTTYWQIQEFMTNFRNKMNFMTTLSEFVVGIKVNKSLSLFSEDTFYYFLEIIFVIAITLTASILLIRPLFFKMASAPFEYKKNSNIKSRPNTTLSPFVSFLKKEILLIVRTPQKINALIIISIVTPLSIYLMNKIYLAMDVRAIGNYMILAFNILMITLMVTSSNSSLSTSLSEEGAAFYITKINPNKYLKFLITKLIFNVIIITISIGISVGIFCTCRSLGFGQGLLIFLIIETVYIAHAFWSAELDIMNPQYDQYATIGSMINNPNDVKSNVLSFALSLLLGIFTFINLTENTLNYYVVWFKLLVIALVFLAFRVYMYITQINIYYKEK